MKILGIIPARYASSRFPGKPLADVRGKSMVQRVYEQSVKAKSLADVVVATDHEQIFNHVERFGGKVILTKKDHGSGTERCNEVLKKYSESIDYVINIQGDEPFIHPEQIDELAAILDGKVEIATLIKAIENRAELFNSNVVKAVIDKHGRALYFSRSTVPHVRNAAQDEWLNIQRFYKHIGMYAYRADTLSAVSVLTPTSLEAAESLEQLRWIENGYAIHVVETRWESFGIDSPEDLAQALELMKG